MTFGKWNDAISGANDFLDIHEKQETLLLKSIKDEESILQEEITENNNPKKYDKLIATNSPRDLYDVLLNEQPREISLAVAWYISKLDFRVLDLSFLKKISKDVLTALAVTNSNRISLDWIQLSDLKNFWKNLPTFEGVSISVSCDEINDKLLAFLVKNPFIKVTIDTVTKKSIESYFNLITNTESALSNEQIVIEKWTVALLLKTMVDKWFKEDEIISVIETFFEWWNYSDLNEYIAYLNITNKQLELQSSSLDKSFINSLKNYNWRSIKVYSDIENQKIDSTVLDYLLSLDKDVFFRYWWYELDDKWLELFKTRLEEWTCRFINFPIKNLQVNELSLTQFKNYLDMMNNPIKNIEDLPDFSEENLDFDTLPIKGLDISNQNELYYAAKILVQRWYWEVFFDHMSFSEKKIKLLDNPKIVSYIKNNFSKARVHVRRITPEIFEESITTDKIDFRVFKVWNIDASIFSKRWTEYSNNPKKLTPKDIKWISKILELRKVIATKYPWEKLMICDDGLFIDTDWRSNDHLIKKDEYEEYWLDDNNVKKAFVAYVNNY